MQKAHALTMLCASIVLVGSTDRVYSARTQIQLIEQALEVFRADTGSYPSTDEGLRALFEEPTKLHGTGRYRAGGYIQSLSTPKDPWGAPYQYQQPGARNAARFDVWSLGADGAQRRGPQR